MYKNKAISMEFVCIRVFNYKLSHAGRNRICISIRSNETRKILSEMRLNARKLIILISRIRFILFTCYSKWVVLLCHCVL